MKNKDLYYSLKALTEKSLEIIKKSKIKLTVFPENSWIKTEHNMFTRDSLPRYYWSSTLQKVKDTIERIKEYAVFLEVIMSDSVICPQLNTLVGTREGRSTFEPFHIVNHTISCFLIDTKIINFDESIFKEEYLKIENFLYSNELVFETLIPLSGFYSDKNIIQFTEDLFIVKLSDSEIIHLLNLGFNIGDNHIRSDIINSVHQFAIKRIRQINRIYSDLFCFAKVDMLGKQGS